MAKTIHGNESRTIRAARKQKMAELRLLAKSLGIP